MELSADNVDAIFLDCLFREDEPKDGGILVSGILLNVGFHPERLESHKTEIHEMLYELPEEFQESRGGGWTFLNAYKTKDGVHWGEHLDMEKLFLLGLGIKEVTCLLPRHTWKLLPGGVPYYAIK